MYIGHEAVKDSKEEAGWVYVTFESGRTARYPNEMYDAMLTVDPSDDTGLRDRRIMKVMQEFVSLLIKYDLTMLEVKSLMTYTENFLEEKRMYATATLFRPSIKNPMPETMHPSRTIDALSIGDINDILEHAKTTDNKGSQQ